MPISNLFPKPCQCSSESFEFHTKQEIFSDKNEYKEIHYEIKICKNCNLSWGSRKNYREIHEIINLTENYRFLTWENEFFYNNFFTLSEILPLDKLLKKIAKTSNETISYPQDIVDRFFHAGFLKRIKRRVNSTQKFHEKLQFTKNAKEFFKQKYNFMDREEQKTFVQQIISDTLEKTPLKDHVIHSYLFDILSRHLEMLKENSPKWFIGESQFIYPNIHDKQHPKYVYIALLLVTWYEHFRKIITYRDLSSRAFTIYTFHRGTDPSKFFKQQKLHLVLEKWVQFNLKKDSLFEAGLVENLKFFHFTGAVHITWKSLKTEKYDSSRQINLSNLEFWKINNIHINNSKLLLVENLAVYTQLILDEFPARFNLTVGYLGGQPSNFIQRILSQINKDNATVKIILWVDWDYGGVQIARVIEKIFSTRLKYVRLPSNMDLPYQKLSDAHRKQLEKLKEHFTSNLTFFVNDLLSNGTIEQEFVLKDYLRIFQENKIIPAEKNIDALKGR